MIALFTRTWLFLLLAVGAMGCLPQKQFYWGTYEESLYTRQQHVGLTGEGEAMTALLATINEAQAASAKVAPGVHADYGYLLFKQGKVEEAISHFQQEAVLYPESKTFINTLVSRIQAKKGPSKPEEKKSAQ